MTTTSKLFELSDPPKPEGFQPAQPERFALLYACRGLFDSVIDGMFVVDANQRVLFSNDTARVLLGQELDSIAPEEWAKRYRFLLPDSAVPTRDANNPLIRAVQGHDLTRQYVEVRGKGIQNVWLSITARPVHDEQGRLSWSYITLRDINLDKWSEEQLRLHDRVLAAASDGIVIIDARHEQRLIVFVNDGFVRLTGLGHEDVVGKPIEFLFREHPDAMEYKPLTIFLPKDDAITVQLHSPRSDGEAFWNRMSITPVSDRNGVLTHYIAVLSDITALMDTEQRLLDTTHKLQNANNQMRRNLAAATKVQQALLPSVAPSVEGLECAWAFEPSEELSGDILNVFTLDDSHIGIYVLDVSGHGVASAMLSVTVSHLLSPVKSTAAIVYEHVQGTDHYEVASPGKVATRLAMRFHWDADVGQFFTLVYGVLNWKTRVFQYVCAGHPPPLCISSHGVQRLERGAHLPIGIGRGDYEEMTVRLEPRTRLYFYSDGVFEAMNPQRVLFGEERLVGTLAAHKNHSLQQSVDKVMAEVKLWRAGATVTDDTSMLAIELR